jgi:RNA-binding protein 25
MRTLCLGFCEFDDAEGVLRAMRILDGFPLLGDELLLNVNQATKTYVESYKAGEGDPNPAP